MAGRPKRRARLARENAYAWDARERAEAKERQAAFEPEERRQDKERAVQAHIAHLSRALGRGLDPRDMLAGLAQQRAYPDFDWDGTARDLPYTFSREDLLRIWDGSQGVLDFDDEEDERLSDLGYGFFFPDQVEGPEAGKVTLSGVRGT